MSSDDRGPWHLRGKVDPVGCELRFATPGLIVMPGSVRRLLQRGRSAAHNNSRNARTAVCAGGLRS